MREACRRTSMRKTLVCLLLFAASSAFARELMVVELSGTPYERGLQHGRALKEAIRQHVLLWKASIHDVTQADPDEFLASFLRDRDFLTPAKHWVPEMIDEVRGIADGAGIPFETIWAKQLGDELWVYEEEWLAQHRAEPNHCSSLGVPKKGAQPAYVAQNMDIESFNDGFQTVLHIREERATPEQYIFTVAGEVALNGINNRSIGVVVNTLGRLQPARDGLPVAFVIRGILRARSGREALRFVKSVKHASGQNYIIGAANRVFDFEASANKVVAYAPNGEGNSVCHTNHAIVNDDYNERFHGEPGHGGKNSEARLRALRSRDLGTDTIKNALRSHDDAENPVCRPLKSGDDDFTFGSTIMTLSKQPALEVSMGPPDVNPYRRFEFTRR